MEVSLQMSSSRTMMNSMVPFPCKAGFKKVSYKLRTISCNVKEVTMQGGTENTNFYQVLSLDHSQNVGLDEIKKAYRSMALRYHPDVCPDPTAKDECTRKFVDLQKAYETLSNPVSRKIYDYELGLGDSSIRCGVGGFCKEDRASGFSREVLENQLYRLQMRSRDRMEKKKNQVN